MPTRVYACVSHHIIFSLLDAVSHVSLWLWMSIKASYSPETSCYMWHIYSFTSGRVIRCHILHTIATTYVCINKYTWIIQYNSCMITHMTLNKYILFSYWEKQALIKPIKWPLKIIFFFFIIFIYSFYFILSHLFFFL